MAIRRICVPGARVPLSEDRARALLRHLDAICTPGDFPGVIAELQVILTGIRPNLISHHNLVTRALKDYRVWHREDRGSTGQIELQLEPMDAQVILKILREFTK